ncbi:MAG TPA: prepilin-type N-terminal cleavage/methylation domain-containing protein [Bacteroidales bacterium]
MILLFTLIELLVVLAIIAVIVAALIKVLGNDKKTRALNNLKNKITELQVAGTATSNDCAEVNRLVTAAQDAGIEQSVIDNLKEKISALCP